jgi:hypothetical protein
MNNKRIQITRLASGLLVLALVLTLILLAGGPTLAASGTAVFINEIHYDNTDADEGEAIEIAGPAGTNLSGWSIALYNGSSSQLNVYDTINLSGDIPDQQDGFGTLSFSSSLSERGLLSEHNLRYNCSHLNTPQACEREPRLWPANSKRLTMPNPVSKG